MTETCATLHEALNALPRHRYPFNRSAIPLNGVYVMFERAETGHGADRIVRIGAHTGVDQLPSRLLQHFVKENKDRSIFRKNVGRCLLNRDNDPFLSAWELDLTSSVAREKYLNTTYAAKCQEIEHEVTSYMQSNFSFVVFPLQDQSKRLHIESRLISTVSLCADCGPSRKWLGLHSPKDKIRESGLWQVNELYKESLTPIELQDLLGLLSNAPTS